MKGMREFNRRVFELFYLYNRRAHLMQDRFVSDLKGSSTHDRGDGERVTRGEDAPGLFRKIRQCEKELFHLYGQGGKYCEHAFAVLCGRLGLGRTEQRILVCLLGIKLKNSVFRESLRLNANFQESASNLVNLIFPDPKSALGQVDLLEKYHRLCEHCLQQSSLRHYNSRYEGWELKPELAGWLLGVSEDEPELAPEQEHEKERDPESLLEVSEPRAGLKSVVLAPESRRQIEQAIYFHQSPSAQKLFAGVGGKNSRSLLALLYGPPGTGKTLTAGALAAEVKKPLARVEYPTLFSMWFGQSDKRLRECFRSSADKGYVLLFDEADALISSRYQANTVSNEVMHRLKNIFLQEIERFPGIVVLTTNMVETLDPALERRLNLKLELPMPKAPERELLWKSMLRKAPLATDVDIHGLAHEFPMAGGHIKNAVIAALREALFLSSRGQTLMVDQALLEKSANQEMQMVEFKPMSKIAGFKK